MLVHVLRPLRRSPIPPSITFKFFRWAVGIDTNTPQQPSPRLQTHVIIALSHVRHIARRAFRHTFEANVLNDAHEHLESCVVSLRERNSTADTIRPQDIDMPTLDTGESPARTRLRAASRLEFLL